MGKREWTYPLVNQVLLVLIGRHTAGDLLLERGPLPHDRGLLALNLLVVVVLLLEQAGDGLRGDVQLGGLVRAVGGHLGDGIFMGDFGCAGSGALVS